MLEGSTLTLHVALIEARRRDTLNVHAIEYI